jgi:hypothetical protein
MEAADRQLENSCMNGYRSLPVIVAACALTAGVAACGSSSPSHSSATSPSTPSSTAPSSSGSPSAVITANWTKFFNAKTPVPERKALLEDGSQFPSSFLAPTGLGAGASAQVLKVSSITASSAKVSYNILLDGTPALKNQTGTAVHQGGTWKVGVSSFCGLLTLENGGKTKGLPAVCKTAG